MTVRATINKIEDILPNQTQVGTKAYGQPPPTRVTNVTKDGRQAIRVEARHDEHRWSSKTAHEGANRTEVVVPGKYAGQPHEVKENSERFYRISFWLPKLPSELWAPNRTILQFAGQDWPSGSYFGILSFASQGQLACTGATGTIPAPFDRWFDVVWRAKHSQTSAEVDVEIDGKLVFKSRGKKTISATGGYEKFGAYGTPRPPHNAVLYFSNLVVATTRAEVAPGSPTPTPTPTPVEPRYLMSCPKCGTKYQSYT